MGGGGKVPDNSAQLAELEKQKQQAQDNADRLAQDNLDATNAQRRRQRGLSLLIGTSDLGVQNKIGQ